MPSPARRPSPDLVDSGGSLSETVVHAGIGGAASFIVITPAAPPPVAPEPSALALVWGGAAPLVGGATAWRYRRQRRQRQQGA